ncbi:MAG: site-2 protease family protein [Roseivirga sp.]|nr:site-2 protease family protein [Roseivirga sp.]
MKSSLYLGQVAKIKVFIHWTFLLLIGYIVYSGVSAGQTLEEICWHILFILTIFFCIVLHEFGHALMGRRFGFKTKDIILLPIGGVARFEKLPEKPQQEFLVAIAGPMVNFAIALILYVTTSSDLADIMNQRPVNLVNAESFLTLLWMVNLTLGVFNLIPAFPMDGGRIFRAFLSIFQPREKATKIAAAVGFLVAIAFIFMGLFYNPFLIIMGAFIILAASSESNMVSTQALLEGHTAGEIVMRSFATLDQNLTIAEASEAILDGQASNFTITTDADRIIGTLKREQVIQALANSESHKKPVTSIMDPVNQTITADTPLKDLYTNELIRTNTMIPVTYQGMVIGVINFENIMEFLAIKQATPLWKNLLQKNRST